MTRFARCAQLDEQRELHRIRVLELVHQQQLEFVVQALATPAIVHRAQRQLLHVGEVDQPAFGLQFLKALSVCAAIEYTRSM